MLTFILDYLTFTTAYRTNALLLHHAEDALCGVGDDARSVTGLTSLLAAAFLGTRTAALRTGDILAYLELLSDAGIDFFQCQLYLQTKVTAAMLLRTTLSASETSESVTAENVTKHRENIVHVHRSTSESAESSESATHVGTVESELVVLLTCLRVVEHVIGLGGLLEFLLSLLVTRIAVRVVFDGYLAIRFLDLVLCCAFADAQHLVVISFLCHLSFTSYCPTATFAWRITLSFSL